MLVLRILLAALGFPALVFLFGWSLLSRCTKLDGEERFATSGAVGIAVVAVGQFVAFVTGIDQTLFNSILALAMLLVAAASYWSATGSASSDGRLPLFW